MPLHRAASEGHSALVELLLERGADREARGYNGMTAESLAVLHRHPRVVSILRSSIG
jgi:ankyrin repeat protein